MTIHTFDREELCVDVPAPAMEGAQSGLMYRRFLESAYSEALDLADLVLKADPDDVMALAIKSECEQALRPPSSGALPLEDPPLSIEVTFDGDDVTPMYVSVAGDPSSRRMCQRFLESDHPTALALAEGVLARSPADRVARAIAEQCRAALERPPLTDDDVTEAYLVPPVATG